MKKDLFHELTIRDRLPRIKAVDKITKKSVPRLRENDKHHWKNHSEDTIKRMGQ